MDAVVRQKVTTVINLVKPVNTQPMAALDGEVPVAEAAAVAAKVVPMSHVEGAVGVVNASHRRCGTRGCSLSDFHPGLCTSVIIDGKRKRKSAVAWSEGSDADEDKHADTRCKQGRQNSQRTKCGSCEHGRQRSRCKECGGSSICEHGRVHSLHSKITPCVKSGVTLD